MQNEVIARGERAGLNSGQIDQLLLLLDSRMYSAVDALLGGRGKSQTDPNWLQLAKHLPILDLGELAQQTLERAPSDRQATVVKKTLTHPIFAMAGDGVDENTLRQVLGYALGGAQDLGEPPPVDTAKHLRPIIVTVNRLLRKPSENRELDKLLIQHQMARIEHADLEALLPRLTTYGLFNLKNSIDDLRMIATWQGVRNELVGLTAIGDAVEEALKGKTDHIVEVAEGLCQKGRYDQAAHVFATISDNDDKWLTATRDCEILALMRSGDLDTAADALSERAASDSSPYAVLADAIDKNDRRLLLSKKRWTRVLRKISPRFREGLEALVTTSGDTVISQIPQPKITVDQLLELGQVPDEVAQTCKALAEHRQRQGDKISKHHQSMEESLCDQAEVAMETFREELVSGGSVCDLAVFGVEMEDAARALYLGRYCAEEISDVLSMIGGHGLSHLREIVVSDKRASASESGVLNLGVRKGGWTWGLAEMVWHEIGHMAEFSCRPLQKAMLEWVKGRATGKLGPLEGDEDAKAYPGPFITPYVGRVYSDGATEVLSMGLQHFMRAQEMVELRTEDPEHFQLMVGVIRFLQGLGK